MVSPVRTSSGTRLPSSAYLPAPTATTVPRDDFSLAESGMMIAPAGWDGSSTRRTTMRSCNGLRFMSIAPKRVRVWRTASPIPSRRWRDAGSRRGARIAAKRFEVFERGRLIGGVPESATLATGNPGTPRHRVLDAPIIPSIQERQSIARRIADDEEHMTLLNLRYDHIIELE